jgi:hypothetical protein
VTLALVPREIRFDFNLKLKRRSKIEKENREMRKACMESWRFLILFIPAAG